jgi:membrane fusion protein, multidrug efflux system
VSFAKLSWKITSLSILVLALLGSQACQKQEAASRPGGMKMPPALVKTATAETGDVPLTVTAVGTVESITSVDVKSRVTGEILRVAFTEGQEVNKGQVLFEIDPEPLKRQIAQLQADLAKDQALEQQARANAARDEATMKQARSSANRGLALSKEGIFSKEQTEQVVATADATAASLNADLAAIESAVASIKSDRARLAQTELQLSYTTITAPISGRAGAVAAKAGNMVKENDAALVTILQLAPIYVSFGVPEQLLPEVRKFNAQSPLKVNAILGPDSSRTGTLRFIDNTVDTTTGTIRLKAEFTNKEHSLWPGQFVDVQAQLNLERNRILIPSRAVQTGPQGKYVWVLDPGTSTVAMRLVNVLRNYQAPKAIERAVIGSGVNAGETVISEGQMRLAPGAKVQVEKGGTQLGASPVEGSEDRS